MDEENEGVEQQPQQEQKSLADRAKDMIKQTTVGKSNIAGTLIKGFVRTAAFKVIIVLSIILILAFVVIGPTDFTKKASASENVASTISEVMKDPAYKFSGTLLGANYDSIKEAIKKMCEYKGLDYNSLHLETKIKCKNPVTGEEKNKKALEWYVDTAKESVNIVKWKKASVDDSGNVTYSDITLKDKSGFKLPEDKTLEEAYSLFGKYLLSYKVPLAMHIGQDNVYFGVAVANQCLPRIEVVLYEIYNTTNTWEWREGRFGVNDADVAGPIYESPAVAEGEMGPSAPVLVGYKYKLTPIVNESERYQDYKLTSVDGWDGILTSSYKYEKSVTSAESAFEIEGVNIIKPVVTTSVQATPDQMEMKYYSELENKIASTVTTDSSGNKVEFKTTFSNGTLEYDNGPRTASANVGTAATGSSSTISAADVGYDRTLSTTVAGRDPARVKIITGSTAPITDYKVGGSYTRTNDQVGSAVVGISSVTVQVWKGTDSNKTTGTADIQVNTRLVNIVRAMFNDIYADSSKPIISTVGGFRASDPYPSHVFGAAIDINADQNPYLKYSGGVCTGALWGNSSMYKPGIDSRSMTASHAIVKIIKDKYGWDWGGSWTNKDYMHFSFIGG